MSPHVCGRVIAATGGNPLALAELARELTPAQLSGISPLPEPLPVGHSLQAVFIRQVNRLPPDSRLLLALAATEPSASQAMLWRSAVQLGIDPEAASSEAGDLVAFTPQATFRHPLVCSVAYQVTPAAQRRRIHQALADQGEEPDRVAWHLGMAAIGPDEAVAARLEQTAERARQRGGYAATVSFLDRAAELSVSGEVRTRRLLAAAEAALAAGQPVRARALLDQAEAGATSDWQVATALRLGGEVSFANGQTGAAARQLLAAARRLMPFDARLGRRTLLTALTAANYTLDDALDEVRAFAAGLVETPVDLADPSSTDDCLLFGFLHRLSGAPKKAAPLLWAAIGHVRDPGTPDAIRMSVPTTVSAQAGTELLDDNAGLDVLNAYVRFARRTGALRLLAQTLPTLGLVLIRHGRFAEAEAACTEGRALGEATGAPGSPDIASMTELALLCWRGHQQEARELAARIRSEAGGGDDRSYRAWLARLELSLGRYRQAYDDLLPSFRDDRLAFGTYVLPDLIEAAARCDELQVAREALNRLEERAEASGAAQALGRLALGQALLAEDTAEPLYRRAIDLLEPTAIRTDLSRTRLLYGEWLRRQRRRGDARIQLGAAYDMFTEIGADAFAARAETELAATGERPRKHSVETRQTLTPREAHIAQLVAEGSTNREVAAELFISPATVVYHLRTVYQKLGITSRTKLTRMMLPTS